MHATTWLQPGSSCPTKVGDVCTGREGKARHSKPAPAYASLPDTIASAKSKGSQLAMDLYASGLSRMVCAADFTGQGLTQLPARLAECWWLQSIAASCNSLVEAPSFHAPALRTLSLAHNSISNIPDTLISTMPNLQVWQSCESASMCSPSHGIRSSDVWQLFTGPLAAVQPLSD
jgi:hypothetical protein